MKGIEHCTRHPWRQKKWRPDPWRSAWAGLLLVLGAACSPPLPSGDAVTLGPALFEILADGAFTCEEHQTRNQYNVCPAESPATGTDDTGVTWMPDELFGGLLPNPFHPDRQCYRGTSESLGLSSYQCCYEDGKLDMDSNVAGSFDFVDPFGSIATVIWHFFFDIWTWRVCEQ